MKNTLVLMLVFYSLKVSAQPVESSGYKLPDGSFFEHWMDKTNYSKTLHVHAHHPLASDDNPGSFSQPYKSINKAAQEVKPGERVLVYSGTYRESIAPRHSGIGPSGMISYEAAPGAIVKIKGSVIFDEPWEPSTAVLGFMYAHNIWQAPLDETKYSPFYTQNANEEEMKLMPWAEKWINKIPYTLNRGLAFQNGKRMTQLSSYQDLLKIPGSFWVDEENFLIHIHPFDDVDPNEHTFELTKFQQLFKPTKDNVNYIRISGFIFEHAGNGYPRVGTGAVFVNGGHHWIIEDNVVRQVNSVAIEAGARLKESRVSSEEEQEKVRQHPGGFIIRNNHIYECGTGGIQGHTVKNSLLEYNHMHDIGWQNAEQYWECSAIKLLVNQNTVVARNLVHDVYEASGIWLDWNNRNSRITSNIIYNHGRTYNGAIFVEASVVPNMIDNNIIWGSEGPGISVYDSDETVLCYNLIAYCNPSIYSKVNTDRSLNGIPLTSKDNAITHNLFYHNKKMLIIENKENTSDYNVFVGEDLDNWQTSGFDNNSVSHDIELLWQADKQILSIKNNNPLPLFDTSPDCTKDMWGNERLGDKTVSAPWQFQSTGVIKLNIENLTTETK